jgi:hypothetical protein
MGWLIATGSALLSFYIETKIDGAIIDWAKSNANGNALFILIIEMLSFLACFSAIFTLLSKLFGGKSK